MADMAPGVPRARDPLDGRRLARTLGDPDRFPIALTCRAAMLLLEAVGAGQNVDRLAARTGSSRSFVARCARRLLDNGVWADGRTVCEWAGEGPAHPSFWNDVAVAEGKLCRRAGEHGALEWAPAGEWIKYYEYRDAGEQPGTRFVPHPGAAARPPVVPGERPHEAAGADPPADRTPPQNPSEDPIGRLFPDAAWIR